MKSLESLLSEDEIQLLATRSNFRYGKEILKDGTFTILKENRFNFELTIQYRNHQTRTTELQSTVKGLRYKCTCSNKKEFFCNHCVAAALYLHQKNEQNPE